MEKIKIKVECFAGLKKYFGSETEIELEANSTFSGLIQKLIILKPEAKEVLTSSRIAVDEEFVDLVKPVKDVKQVFLIPPSSGG